MSVEQTSQLIQLILNSVLLVVICSVLTVGLILRCLAIGYQLRLLRQTYFDLLAGSMPLRHSRLVHLKTQLLPLRYHYRLACCSSWTSCTALVCSLISTLLMSLRTLIQLNVLIPIALVFFVIGIGMLLLSIGFVLLDFHRDEQSLLTEIQWILTQCPTPISIASSNLTMSHKPVRRLRSRTNPSASGMN